MSKIKITEVLQALGCGKIKPAGGGNLLCACPFAQWTHPKGVDHNPSFAISNSGKWICYSCNRKGLTVKSLVRQFENASGNSLGFDDEAFIVRKLTYDPKIQTRWFSENWHGNLSDQVKKEVFLDWNNFSHFYEKVPTYALDRGLSLDQIKKWRLGFNEIENRLFIPIVSEMGTFVGYSQRAIPPAAKDEPKYKHYFGFIKNKYFYGENFLDKKNRVGILVEGFADAWRLDGVGVRNVLACMGTTPSEHQLRKAYEWFDSIIYIPDNDDPNLKTGLAPGAVAAEKWRKALLEIGKKVVISPVIKGRKDVGEWTGNEILYVLNKISVQYSIPVKLPAK